MTRPSPDPKNSLWDFMAYYLRFLRTQHNMTGETVGRLIQRSKSTISRYESGEYRLTDHDCEALDQAWNTGGLFSTLLHYARLGHDPDWLRQYIDHEAQATVIKSWHSNLVPGLLQTPDYARAGLMAGGVKDVDAAVAERMGRQAILDRENPPTLLVMLAESLLELPCGNEGSARTHSRSIRTTQHRRAGGSQSRWPSSRPRRPVHAADRRDYGRGLRRSPRRRQASDIRSPSESIRATL